MRYRRQPKVTDADVIPHISPDGLGCLAQVNLLWVHIAHGKHAQQFTDPLTDRVEFSIGKMRFLGMYASDHVLCDATEPGIQIVHPSQPDGRPDPMVDFRTRYLEGVAHGRRHVQLTYLVESNDHEPARHNSHGFVAIPNRKRAELGKDYPVDLIGRKPADMRRGAIRNPVTALIPVQHAVGRRFLTEQPRMPSSWFAVLLLHRHEAVADFRPDSRIVHGKVMVFHSEHRLVFDIPRTKSWARPVDDSGRQLERRVRAGPSPRTHTATRQAADQHHR
nr:hypothetical protein [Nocardia pneumoniae]